MAFTIQIVHDHGQVEVIAKGAEAFVVAFQDNKGGTGFRSNIADLGHLGLLLDLGKDMMVIQKAKGPAQGAGPKPKVIPVTGAIPGLKVHKGKP